MDEKNADGSSANPFADAPVIFSYTRAQAIEDGVLVDLTAWARETGFRIPMACTAAVWHGYIVPPKGTEGLGQSERGRGHDLLWMLWLAIRQSGRAHAKLEPDRSHSEDIVLFDVIFLQAPNKPETVRLKAHCGPGDQGEPVITIMLPGED
ncbi:MAG: hypothetical protein HZA51_12115 [Planctomycetes bacterium]|nr:hypothetical protein [Planctomycetota bacterium]